MRGVVLDSRENDASSVVLFEDGRIEVVEKFYIAGDEIELKPEAIKRKTVIYLWQKIAVCAAVFLLVFGLASPRIAYASVTVDGVKYGVNMYNQVISVTAVDDSAETIAFVEENKDAYNRRTLDEVLDDVTDKMLDENKDTLEFEVDGPSGIQEKLKARADEYKERIEEKKREETASMNVSEETLGKNDPIVNSAAGAQDDVGLFDGAGGTPADDQAAPSSDDQTAQPSNDQAIQPSNDQGAQPSDDHTVQSSNDQGAQSSNDQGAQSSNDQGAQSSNDQGAQSSNDQGAQPSNNQGEQFAGGHGEQQPYDQGVQNAENPGNRTGEVQGSGSSSGGHPSVNRKDAR